MNYKEFEKEKLVKMGDGYDVKAYGEGAVCTKTWVSSRLETVLLREVLYVPDLKFNLFSLKGATEFNCKVIFEKN